MRNYEKKLPKYKRATAAALIALGLSVLPTAGHTQEAEAWTGSVPGTNIHWNSKDMLASIKKMLNDNQIERAVLASERYVASMERESRSGKTTKFRYDAYNALCISLTAQKSYDDAREACNTAIKDSPKRWFAYNSRGSLNFRSGNFSDAVSDYRMALNNAPKSSNVTAIIEHNINLAQSQN